MTTRRNQPSSAIMGLKSRSVYFCPCNEIIMALCDMSAHSVFAGICGSPKESLSLVIVIFIKNSLN
jgi:hypothetical protein